MSKECPSETELRARGYRLTPQRLAVLNILQSAGSHMTPAQVYRRAHEVMPGITEATVYRTLSFLAAQGLVQPAYIGSGQFVYEYGGQDHHHLICRRCGGMHAIDHETLIPLYRQVQESTGFQIDSVHLTFFGLCPECARN